MTSSALAGRSDSFENGPFGRRTHGGAGQVDLDGDGHVSRYADLQGVGRAFAILEQVAERPMRASALARTLGLKWTTAHRTLSYLTSMGYLERDERSGEYFVGVRAYSLGSSYVASLRLAESARPYLHAASILGNGTAQLVKRDHRRSVVLSVFDPGRQHVAETTIGCNFPLHCGSKGHVLLAYAPQPFLDAYLTRPLERLTPHTLTDPRVLYERVADVRGRGFAVTSRDVRMFSASVAAPVRDRLGHVVASVTLVVPPDDLDAREQQLTQLVLRAAQSISRAVGVPRHSGLAVAD
jgi:DNA-binding IclR family transcriptional regulator